MERVKTGVTEADIFSLVHDFYVQVRRDDFLGPVFNAAIPEDHWPEHILHIQDFWSGVFLKTGRFTGNPMYKHAQLSGLTPAHFKHWLLLFKETAHQILEPDVAVEFVTMANRIGQSLQMGLAFQHAQTGQDESPFKSFGLQM